MREYLAAVLPGLNNFSIHRVAELTPKAWTAKQNQPRLITPTHPSTVCLLSRSRSISISMPPLIR